jgi:hypothetical protein
MIGKSYIEKKLQSTISPDTIFDKIITGKVYGSKTALGSIIAPSIVIVPGILSMGDFSMANMIKLYQQHDVPLLMFTAFYFFIIGRVIFLLIFNKRRRNYFGISKEGISVLYDRGNMRLYSWNEFTGSIKKVKSAFIRNSHSLILGMRPEQRKKIRNLAINDISSAKEVKEIIKKSIKP